MSLGLLEDDVGAVEAHDLAAAATLHKETCSLVYPQQRDATSCKKLSLVLRARNRGRGREAGAVEALYSLCVLRVMHQHSVAPTSPRYDCRCMLAIARTGFVLTGRLLLGSDAGTAGATLDVAPGIAVSCVILTTTAIAAAMHAVRPNVAVLLPLVAVAMHRFANYRWLDVVEVGESQKEVGVQPSLPPNVFLH